MYFAEIQSEIKRRIKNVTTETTTAVKIAINNAYYELWNMENWWFARREMYFDTTAVYTTGTASATQYSASITGVGTAWTDLMVGRRFIFGGDNKSYVIKAVGSVSGLTLDTVYSGAAQSGATYSIAQDIYRLDDRATKMLFAWQNATPSKLEEMTDREFSLYRPNPITIETSRAYKLIGQTTVDYYNTGTVSAVSGSAFVKGVTTTWTSAMVGMGFKIDGDDNEYIITAVSAVSALTLEKNYSGSTTSAGTYHIGAVGCEQIQLYPIPAIAHQVRYKCIARPKKLIRDNDIPELPPQWHYLLVLGGYYRVIPERETDITMIQLARDDYYKAVEEMKKWHNASEDRLPFFADDLEGRNLNDSGSWIYRD